MTKYNYKRIIIDGWFYDLFDGKELINPHNQYIIWNKKSVFYKRSEYSEILDYTSIRDHNVHKAMVAKFGDNIDSWGSITTDTLNPDWVKIDKLIANAKSTFEQYNNLLQTGYKLYQKTDNCWYFELAYENNIQLDAINISNKLLVAENDIKKLNVINNYNSKQLNEVKEQKLDLHRKIDLLNERVSNDSKLIITLKESNVELSKTIVDLQVKSSALDNDLYIATSRAEHLETSLDEVTNDNHLLRAQVKSLEEKSKKKGWFK